MLLILIQEIKKESKLEKTFNCSAAFLQIGETSDSKFEWLSISIPKSVTVSEVSIELMLIIKICGLILPLPLPI